MNDCISEDVSSSLIKGIVDGIFKMRESQGNEQDIPGRIGSLDSLALESIKVDAIQVYVSRRENRHVCSADRARRTQRSQ
jgi:hypothetical protein